MIFIRTYFLKNGKVNVENLPEGLDRSGLATIIAVDSERRICPENCIVFV